MANTSTLRKAATKNLFKERLVGTVKHVRKDVGAAAVRNLNAHANESTLARHLRESLLQDVRVPFYENVSMKRRRILETIEDVICGRGTVSDQEVIASLNADPTFSDLSDADMSKERHRKFRYTKIDKSCPLAFKMSQDAIEYAVYLSKEYRESYLKEYKEWLENSNKFLTCYWAEEDREMEKEPAFQNVLRVMG